MGAGMANLPLSMGKPELSVIVPTYGRAEQALRAVKSALAQDIDLEVVVVDDGSPTPIEMDAGAPRVTIVRLENNQGAAAARNAGVAAAKAQWIALLDSDDVWPALSLRPRLDAARGAGDAGRTIWAAGFVDVWPNGRRGAVRRPKPSARATDFAAGCWSCPGSTALLSRAAWERSGGQDPALRRLEDYEWLFRWGLAGGRLEIHDGVGAEINRGWRAAPDLIAAAAAYVQTKHAAAPKTLTRRMESYLQLELAASLLRHGAGVGGVLALTRSWLLHPRLQAALEPFWASAE